MHSDFGPAGQIWYYVISYLCICVCVYGVHIFLCVPYYIIFCLCLNCVCEFVYVNE